MVKIIKPERNDRTIPKVNKPQLINPQTLQNKYFGCIRLRAFKNKEKSNAQNAYNIDSPNSTGGIITIPVSSSGASQTANVNRIAIIPMVIFIL